MGCFLMACAVRARLSIRVPVLRSYARITAPLYLVQVPSGHLSPEVNSLCTYRHFPLPPEDVWSRLHGQRKQTTGLCQVESNTRRRPSSGVCRFARSLICPVPPANMWEVKHGYVNICRMADVYTLHNASSIDQRIMVQKHMFCNFTYDKLHN
jgi:hypothetical protein